MSGHLAPRSSVGSHNSALPSHRHLPHNPDPLASVWVRRLHLVPNPPPPPRQPLVPRRAPPPPQQDPVSTDESRKPPPPPLPHSAGFGPFRWSMRQLRGAPVGAWDAAAVSGCAGGVQPMLSPFFRLPAPSPVTPITEIEPASPLVRLGSSRGSAGGYTGPSSHMLGDGDHHAPWLGARAAGAAYPSHALDMAPIRTLNDLHDRQYGMMPQHFARHDPSSSSQHDEPFSYWNMGRLQRNTTTSSISPIGVDVVPGNFGNKRNAESTSFLPLKFRKLSGAT